MHRALPRPLVAAISLAAALLATTTHAQSGYIANELLPAVKGTSVSVLGFDGTGRAVGMSNVSLGLKYDILVGFHIKYEYFDAMWPASGSAVRPVALPPAGLHADQVNIHGDMAGVMAGQRVLVSSNGQVLRPLERAWMLSDLNAQRLVVGSIETAPGQRVPALWEGSTPVLLPMGDFTEGEALAVNAKGQVAGVLRRYVNLYTEAVPVVWTNGRIDWIGPSGTPPVTNDLDSSINDRWSGTSAIGMADDGTVLFRVDERSAMAPGIQNHYLRRPDGSIVAARGPDGARLSLTEMNARGDAVGQMKVGNAWVPVLRKADGTVIDLPQWAKSGLIKLPSGAGTLTSCSRLSDEGMMVCETKVWGLFGNTMKRFRLVPR